jgi:hypothetical protein
MEREEFRVRRRQQVDRATKITTKQARGDMWPASHPPSGEKTRVEVLTNVTDSEVLAETCGIVMT